MFFENKSKHYYQRFTYNNYEVRYEIYKDKLWYAIIEPYDKGPTIKFHANNKKSVQLNLENWAIKKINVGLMQSYTQNYKVYPVHPDVMLSVRDCLIGYHICKSDYRKYIQTLGLVPNGTEDIMVKMASRLIDQHRPFYIPKNIVRENCNYAWPIMTNYNLYYEEDESAEQNEIYKQSCLKNAKDYWKYSCSLKAFIKNRFRIKRIDKYVGLDEIIIPEVIPPEDLLLIGHWDNDGIFHEKPAFANYVKSEFKNSYKEILNKFF